MKRHTFLTGIFALLATPVLSRPVGQKRIALEKGFKVPSGEGRKHGHLKLKGVNANVLDVKISGSDTNGDLAIFEQTSLSKGRGTPLHVHPLQDEIFYVIKGAYRFKVGSKRYELRAGDTIFLPRQVPHAWIQDSETGKMLVTLQPAGKLEDFFVSMAGLDHEPTPEEIKLLFAKNEMQVVGPLLEPLN
jgi:quercetin dioxygenase-like cupin family protein